MVRPLFMPCPPSWPSMARHQIEIQIDFSRFGSQRRHIQDIAAVPKKLNRTLVCQWAVATGVLARLWATLPGQSEFCDGLRFGPSPRYVGQLVLRRSSSVRGAVGPLPVDSKVSQ